MWNALKKSMQRTRGTNPDRVSVTSTSDSQDRWIDLATIMLTKDLQWRARTLVHGLSGGLHRSPKHGFSIEFSEYRSYSHGDNPADIDWKVFARTDRHYIKKFEDETNRRCYVLLDKSRSMTYGSISYTKADYAMTVAATLGYFFNRQRDAVGLATFTDQVESWLPAQYRPGHLRRLIADCESTPSDNASGFAESIDQIYARLRPNSLVVVISDFLAPLEDLQESFDQLASRNQEVVLLRVLDPRELDFDLGMASMMEDLESRQHMYVDPEAAKASYQQRFESHAETMQTIAETRGLRLLTVSTQLPIEIPVAAMIRGTELTDANSTVAQGVAH